MSAFTFTPDLLRWIRAYAPVMNAADMAAYLGCAPSSLRNICANFRIELAKTSDPHADLAPARPTPVKVERPPEVRVHPRLNPQLRPNHLTGFLELRPQRNAIANLDRKAAELRTTPALLAAVILEIVAADNLFDAVLNLDA